MKTIDMMGRAELECEILSNDDLYTYFGGDDNLSKISKMTDFEVRSKILEWIMKGDESLSITNVSC